MNERKAPKGFRFTTKTMLYLGGLGGLLAFIIVSAVWDLVFGTFDVVNFVADTLILVAIALGTLVLTELFSVEANQNKLHGVYNIALNAYADAMARIEPIRIYFSQWYYWFLERETIQKRKNYLMLNGIKGLDAEKIVKFAEQMDISCMVNAKRAYVKELLDGRKVVLPRLEPYQGEVVRDVLQGKHDVIDNGYTEYLFIDDMDEATMSVLERNEYLKAKRAASKRRANILTIIRLIGTSLLFAALVPADPEEATANKWWIFFKRIGVFCTSTIVGWFAGSNDVVAAAAIIRNKTDRLLDFSRCYEAKEWKPKGDEELDKEIIEEYEKEQQEAKDSVVDPELIPDSKLKLLPKGGQ